MPAYNAGGKIISVIDRIPKDILIGVSKIIIVNDGSIDDTRVKIDDVRTRLNDKVIVIDKIQNEGYAKAQKDSFAKALECGADIVVLLHADGQYAPEALPELLRPLEMEVADIVQGSRMLKKGNALRGGMPIHKFIANIILSTLENAIFGLHFAEYHSGYMLYNRKALEVIPFLTLSNTFHFDGEMLFVGAKKGLRVTEIPILTHYGDETSHVPFVYVFHVLGIMLSYLRGKYNA